LFAANPYLQDHTGIGRGFETREFPVDDKWKKKSKDATMGKILPDDASNTLAPKWKPGRYPSGRSADKAKDSGPVATEALLGWLDARPEKERPFFATINYMEAHIPRIPTLASRKALFTDAQIADQLKFDQSFGYLLAYTVGLHEFSPPELELIGQVYDATLRDLDAVTGDLLDKLEARGVLDDTIVIITADHGEHLGDHHRADHKFSVYNALVRVPLIVRFPKQMEARRATEVVSSLDVFATIAELTGTPLPSGTLSKSLLADRGDAALSELVEPTRAVFERMERAHPEFNRAPYELTYTAIETPTLKCIQRSDGHRELYDMIADPSELTDLAPARPADAEALCGRIAAWKASFPAYDPAAASAGDGPGAMDAETMKALEALGYTSPDEAPAPSPRRKKGGGE
jgi:arylsulfatase A-like enzyme